MNGINFIKDSGSLANREVNDNLQQNKAQNEVNKTKTTPTNRGDVITISSEAKNLNLTRARISSGYYNKPEVLAQTAEKLYNAIFKKEENNKENQ